MKNKAAARTSPLLSKFEVLIFDDDSGAKVRYDEARMLLVSEGKPAASQRDLHLPMDTTHTKVARETTDDR